MIYLKRELTMKESGSISRLCRLSIRATRTPPCSILTLKARILLGWRDLMLMILTGRGGRVFLKLMLRSMLRLGLRWVPSRQFVTSPMLNANWRSLWALMVPQPLVSRGPCDIGLWSPSVGRHRLSIAFPCNFFHFWNFFSMFLSYVLILLLCDEIVLCFLLISTYPLNYYDDIVSYV